jgi:hypothetical protein
MNKLDRLNRVVVTVLAVLLIAAGAYGLVRGFGGLGEQQEADPLLTDEVRRFFSDNEWVWAVILVAALLVAWVGWRWLRLQLLPTPSLSSLVVTEEEGGRTELDSGAVADAVTRDLEADPDITSARVRVVGEPRAAGLDVRAAVAGGADPMAVRGRIEGPILGRARSALRRDDLPATVRLRLAAPAASRVE